MEIIQPWQLYLILQADNIGAMVRGFTSLTVVIALMLAFAVVVGAVAHCASSGDAGIRPSAIWKVRWWLLLFYLFVIGAQLLSALIPSTKTAAIMLGVPAVINNPTFQQETGEVYQLLKKALSDTVQKKEQEKTQ